MRRQFYTPVMLSEEERSALEKIAREHRGTISAALRWCIAEAVRGRSQASQRQRIGKVIEHEGIGV